jgi:hypothetical protein
MVRAILDGRKTQTRRICKLPINLVNKNGQVEYGHGSRTKTNHPKDISPFGKPGDLLWVRETWGEIIDGIVYKASDLPENVVDNLRWKPSLFMPKSACRLWLQIKDIRVERLQDWAFCLLWESINKKTHPWESNPWVWVIEFERVEKLNEVKG